MIKDNYNLAMGDYMDSENRDKEEKEHVIVEGKFDNEISNEDYHAGRSHISSSGLKLLLRDERAFYKQYITNETAGPSGPALDIGSYLHCMILEPHLLDIEFAVYQGAQRRGAAYEVFKKEHEGKTILTKSQHSHVSGLVDNFNKGKIIIGDDGNEKEVMISSFFTKGKPEESLFGELDGVNVKVRFDYRKEWDDFASINDLKTTGDMAHTPLLVENVCRKWDYDLSAALYVDMASKYTNKPHDFYFTFISKADGGTYIYKASDQMLTEGRRKYKEAIVKLKLARETGIYYINKIKEINSI